MDFVNDILNEIERQRLEYNEKTLAKIIEKYDIMVCSTECMNKLKEILPEGAHNITYSPYIGDPTTIYAIKKFDIMDWWQEKEESKLAEILNPLGHVNVLSAKELREVIKNE